MTRLRIGILIAVAAIALAALAVYSGVVDVAADVPHSALVYALIEGVKDRSIAVRTKDIRVPPLDDIKLIAEGAKHYDAMCVDCHLAPGVKQSDLRDGLYPQPPNLTEKINLGPAEMFWVVKHGVKMSAMPAWGKTHDEQSLWGIVAFLQRLPDLAPEQYHALVEQTGEAHRHDHHHSHDHDGEGKHHE
ncbi:MAG TPA: cytochrome c [Burkholderiales bacterium]|nr:cytochrome c [Burkholderiales bacterium]